MQELTHFDFEPLDPPDGDSAGRDEPEDEAAPTEVPVLVRQGVRVGPVRLLFDFVATSQLSEMVPITPLPATPHGLRGLASLHGNVLPVFDLAAILDLERETPQKELLLVVGHGEAAAAILVDGLPDRFRVAESDRLPDGEQHPWLAQCTAATYGAAGDTWIDVDYRKLLDQLEQFLRSPQT